MEPHGREIRIRRSLHPTSTAMGSRMTARTIAESVKARRGSRAWGMRATRVHVSASGSARACLQIADWTHCEFGIATKDRGGSIESGLGWLSLDPGYLRLGQRAELSLQLSNPFAVADVVLHGSNALRGWGQQSVPVNDLLVVRGFDALSKRYLYDVNQRFGTNSLFGHRSLDLLLYA